jgi:organic radical activating enzyme
MAKKEGESDREYRERVIDPISDSFCAAKWLNATIWLGHGGTTSCHHPPAHNIDVAELKDNPSAIHNTKHKKKMRKMMLEGERPKECEYCWKIEDMGKDSDGNIPVSDRTYKTHIHDDKAIDIIATSNPDTDVNLKTLEIAFNRTCNFACSYCNPAFSSTWVKDIRKHGGYKNIKSDARGHFIDDAPYAEPFAKGEANPYVDAFWKWWPELSKELTEIRVTGGEPLMTPDIYQLFDWFNENPETDMQLAINSNLGAKKDLIDKMIEGTQTIKHFHLYTSCEAFGPQAEYIRDGLDWDYWTSNMERVCEEGCIEGLHMMMTINALCLDSIIDFLEWILTMKRKYGRGKPGISVNILRFPSFQSALTLPDDLRKLYHDELSDWLDSVRETAEVDMDGQLLIQAWEQDQLSRLIEYLDVVKTPHRDTATRDLLEHDFKVFYDQYDNRRGKNFVETFPRMKEFYEGISVYEQTEPEADIQQVKREVSEDGVVTVIRPRKTGESDEGYDTGSSIGWSTDNDGLGA